MVVGEHATTLKRVSYVTITTHPCRHLYMGPTTEHERPAKRVKRDELGSTSTSTSPPADRDDETSDTEEPEVVARNSVAHGSDLYLDTV